MDLNRAQIWFQSSNWPKIWHTGVFHVVPGFANRKIDFGQNLAIFWSNLPFLTFKCELLHFHVFWNSYIFWNFGLKFGTNDLCMDIKKFVCQIFDIMPRFEKKWTNVKKIADFHEFQDKNVQNGHFLENGVKIQKSGKHFFYIYTKMICAKFQPKIPKNVGVPKYMKVQ